MNHLMHFKLHIMQGLEQSWKKLDDKIYFRLHFDQKNRQHKLYFRWVLYLLVSLTFR